MVKLTGIVFVFVITSCVTLSIAGYHFELKMGNDNKGAYHINYLGQLTEILYVNTERECSHPKIRKKQE